MKGKLVKIYLPNVYDEESAKTIEYYTYGVVCRMVDHTINSVPDRHYWVYPTVEREGVIPEKYLDSENVTFMDTPIAYEWGEIIYLGEDRE
jgi:hypothetical protein